MPWYLFLFVGAFDCGFMSYSLMAAETGAASAVEYTSTNSTTATDTTGACFYALEHLRNLPNVGSSLTTCGTSSVTASAPVAISASLVNSGPDLNQAAAITLTYLTPQLVPIPGLLPGQLTITKTFKMRLRG